MPKDRKPDWIEVEKIVARSYALTAPKALLRKAGLSQS
jgi:hypothetical protein